MGKEWVRTPEQEAYLVGEFNGYLNARKNKEVKIWRTKLHEKWEERWPERQFLIDEWKLADDAQFSTAQMTALGDALAARQKQLYNYIRWRTDAKPVRAKNPQPLFAHYLNKTASAKKGSKKPKRKRTILEIYSDRYYKSKIKSLINDELNNDPQYESLPRTKKVTQRLSVYKRIRADCWKNETDEVKAEVQKIFDEEHEAKEGDEASVDGSETETEKSDDDHNNDDDEEKTLLRAQQECIDSVGSIVAAFLQDCHEATGFAWQLIGGGLDKSGEIKVVMCSAGKTPNGQKFQDIHPSWQGGLVSPWYDFLRQRHPVEERHRRASLWALPSVSKTTPNPATIPSPQLHTSPTDPSATNTSVTSPQLEFTTVNPPQVSDVTSLLESATVKISQVGDIPSAQYQPVGNIPSSQYQPVGSILSSQYQSVGDIPSSQYQSVGEIPSSEYQPTTVHPSTLVGSHSPTVITSPPQFQTTPSTLTSLSAFSYPAMPQISQPPRPNSPMTEFMNSASPLYAWDRVNSVPTSLNSSNSYNFSGINFSDSPDSGSIFGMDQYWNLNTNTFPIHAPIGNTTAFINSAPGPMLDTIDTPLHPTLQNNATSMSGATDGTSDTSQQESATNTMGTPPLPTLQNNATNTSGVTDGTSDTSQQESAMNTMGTPPPPTLQNNATNTSGVTDGTSDTSQQESDKSKKRKTYEERNSHCILPEGSRRKRKPRLTEGAKDAGPKKRYANKKEKSKGKK